MTTIYGIKNCDTIKKAIKWLRENNIDYTFHDYRKSPLNGKILSTWLQQVNYEVLLNKRSTTWRNLSDVQKNNLNEQSAKDLMLENNTLIKRPVLIHNNQIFVGFENLVSALT